MVDYIVVGHVEIGTDRYIGFIPIVMSII